MSPALRKALDEYAKAWGRYQRAWNVISRRIAVGKRYAPKLTADCRDKYKDAQGAAMQTAHLLLAEERARQSKRSKEQPARRGRAARKERT